MRKKKVSDMINKMNNKLLPQKAKSFICNSLTDEEEHLIILEKNIKNHAMCKNVLKDNSKFPWCFGKRYETKKIKCASCDVRKECYSFLDIAGY